MSDEDVEKLRYVLLNLTMQNEWEEVVKLYKDRIDAHRIKVAKSEETAFHRSISSYNPNSPTYIHERCTLAMMGLMENFSTLSRVLAMKNERGDTPLHIAAAVGWDVICERILELNGDLIRIRNNEGETPLFVAAHHGNLEAFRSLHLIYVDQRKEADDSLCRRIDGNTILHSTIAGEHLKLAYLIIAYYEKLINFVNVDGETPLHVLARKPNLFQSSFHLGFYHSIIYQCVFVDDLKQPPKLCPRVEKFPENYRTCVNIFSLLWDPIYKTCQAGLMSKRRNRDVEDATSTDEEDQPYVEYGVPIYERFQASSSRSKKQNKNVGNRTEGAKEMSKYFPPNYTTCISIFLLLPRVILTLLGFGFGDIKQIREKKVMHSYATKILSEMINFEATYNYYSKGERFVDELKPHRPNNIEVPDKPPHEEANIGTAYDQKDDYNDQNQSGDKCDSLVKDTPFLVAARMGIPEMVKKIIGLFPTALLDRDSQGKNALMVAAENQQASVFDCLLQVNVPNHLFHDVDNEGNNILHLAAKFPEKRPSHIPGAALRMVWEIKWYEYVKMSVPPLFSTHRNKKDETPNEIFTRTHRHLVNSGNKWLVKTSESYSLVATLIATVAFATSATVPGGLNQSNGYPMLQDHHAFDIFSIASLVALCLSVTALVFFLTMITSRFEERDFRQDLPRKLLVGLTCLFSSISAMLLSFCAGHTFILAKKLKIVAVPVYAATTIPVTFFAVAHLPLYFDLLWACTEVPVRN